MMRRSRAREVALQLLFQRDHNPGLDRASALVFARGRLRDPASEKFCLELYDGVVAGLADIDQRLSAAAENWRLARMAGVDRNVLRIGAWEMMQPAATPPSVVINEAIELVRRFGSADSPAFVNGVLDRLKNDAAPETVPENDAAKVREGDAATGGAETTPME